MVRIPALQRGADILRQLGIHRVDGDAVDDEARRQVADDEADGERDERARADAAEKLRGQEGAEVGRQRSEQAREEQERDAEQQHAPHAENGAEIGRGDADQHLADAEARRDPGAFVKPGVQAAAQVGEPEGRHAAADACHHRAEQDAQNADIGPQRVGASRTDRAAARMDGDAGAGDRSGRRRVGAAAASGAGTRSRRRRRACGASALWPAARRCRSSASTDMPGRTSVPSAGSCRARSSPERAAPPW